MMKKLTALVPLVLMVSLTSAFAANDRLSFADLGGIRDFRPDGDEGIYIEGQNRQWYHADFLKPCRTLPYNERVGFVLEPSGDINQFSSIVVGGEQCYFKSFEKVEKPE